MMTSMSRRRVLLLCGHFAGQSSGELVRIQSSVTAAAAAESREDTARTTKANSTREDEEFEAYVRRGEERALSLPNRGPLEFEKDGRLAKHIVQAYENFGFYVFQGAIGPEELSDLRKEYEEIIDKAPVLQEGDSGSGDKRTGLDRHGATDLETQLISDGTVGGPIFIFGPPLGDPNGGTNHMNGRHPVKMRELEPAAGAPERVPMTLLAPMAYMDSALRLYGHPGLLRVAEAIHGEDFTGFRDVIWVKQPGLGPAVSWHQDGTTHPFDQQHNHGFNFMAQLYGSDGRNGLWVLPGTQLPLPQEQWTMPAGRADIKAMVRENGGSDRLEGAVPMVTEPGDVVVCNRQCVHGSFPNASEKLRVSIVFGFHPKRQVLGARGEGRKEPYDEARIARRARVIALGIEARKQQYPTEEPYAYKPAQGLEVSWDDQGQRDEIRKKYNEKSDLGI